jgi:hypothetical protein
VLHRLHAVLVEQISTRWSADSRTVLTRWVMLLLPNCRGSYASANSAHLSCQLQQVSSHRNHRKRLEISRKYVVRKSRCGWNYGCHTWRIILNGTEPLAKPLFRMRWSNQDTQSPDLFQQADSAYRANLR